MMITRVLGNKIGMTQVFTEDKKVVPVTVIDVSDWLVTQIKKASKEGYSALQLGKLRKKYKEQAFSLDWISDLGKYFSEIKEIRLDDSKSEEQFSIGLKIKISDHLSLNKGDKVDVSGISRGLGFQGVEKRWGFSGGPSAHGSMFHRAPGASGHMRRWG